MEKGYKIKALWEVTKEGKIVGISDLWQVETPGPYYYLRRRVVNKKDLYIALDSDMQTPLFQDDSKENVLQYIKETVEAHLVYRYCVCLKTGAKAFFATNMDSEAFEELLTEELLREKQLKKERIVKAIKEAGFYGAMISSAALSPFPLEQTFREEELVQL